MLTLTKRSRICLKAKRAIRSREMLGVLSPSYIDVRLESGLLPLPALSKPLKDNTKHVKERQIPSPIEEGTLMLPDKYKKRNVAAKRRYANSNKVIGGGFFAQVHLAVDTVTGEEVAVKVLKKDKTPKSIYLKELEVMEALDGTNDPRLIGFRDAFETETEICFVFELCHGGDLFDIVAENGGLRESDAAAVLEQLVKALDTVHSRNVVHRDVKLENILLKEKGSFKDIRLTDFGYAQKMNTKDSFQNLAGTYGYVAPEVLQYKLYSKACDVWGAGCVLYMMLAGQAPFPHDESSKGDMLEKEIEAIQHGTDRSFWRREMESEPFANVSLEAKDLLRKMLDPNPVTRVTLAEVLKHEWIRKQVEVSSLRARMGGFMISSPVVNVPVLEEHHHTIMASSAI